MTSKKYHDGAYFTLISMEIWNRRSCQFRQCVHDIKFTPSLPFSFPKCGHSRHCGHSNVNNVDNTSSLHRHHRFYFPYVKITDIVNTVMCFGRYHRHIIRQFFLPSCTKIHVCMYRFWHQNAKPKSKFHFSLVF